MIMNQSKNNMNNTNKPTYTTFSWWDGRHRKYEYTPVPDSLPDKLEENANQLPHDIDQVFEEIARTVMSVEEQTGYSIYFKNQKPWKRFQGLNPVKLIAASIPKLDMPSNACVCWLATVQRTWRFTPQYHEGDDGQITRHSHLEFAEYPSGTYINGTDLQGDIDHMHQLAAVIWATKQVWEYVYGL